MNETRITTLVDHIDPFEVTTAARLDDLLCAVRMSWDELFELPEPRLAATDAA